MISRQILFQYFDFLVLFVDSVYVTLELSCQKINEILSVLNLNNSCDIFFLFLLYLLVQMDFAENYSCKSVEEIQTAYWNQTGVTLHPVVVYYKKNGETQHKS
jgi:hypothetical protein